ncbi:GroES-like protein [Pleomassaria siparia CBS 279.74]|uniref:GroES-like protein n=1 Tax=Pleomassaria siparia CBS 279.74 TaxID=1314801 RepID=A0A6G1JTQ6_9PLEO|nr:GroES-like protein [Pleomassaria siparia CBS 279.74]
MATHTAIATVAKRAPLDAIQVPTITPTGDQVRIRVEWTASTPLDLHQNDGGLLVTHPQVLGGNIAGTVVQVGSEVKRLNEGDKVFGFTWRDQGEKGYQTFCTTNEWLVAVIPEGFTMAEAVTLSDNFVTVFHSLTTDLGIELPWPKPSEYVPEHADGVFLVWGGSSSVGQFAIQILKYYGYASILATASPKHHSKLHSYGATQVFDYRSSSIVSDIVDAAEKTGGVKWTLDCIGSQEGSMKPISQIVKSSSRVAILLPVIVLNSNENQDPVYSMDVQAAAEWQDGVDVRGVRTHSYLHNEFFKYHLQPDIMPTMLKERIVEPNAQRIIEGKTMLERAQKAMDTLRSQEASGERLVWRVADV